MAVKRSLVIQERRLITTLCLQRSEVSPEAGGQDRAGLSSPAGSVMDHRLSDTVVAAGKADDKRPLGSQPPEPRNLASSRLPAPCLRTDPGVGRASAR